MKTAIKWKRYLIPTSTMEGRESLAQAFTLLSFASAGLIGLSRFWPLSEVAQEPRREAQRTEQPRESHSSREPLVASASWLKIPFHGADLAQAQLQGFNLDTSAAVNSPASTVALTTSQSAPSTGSNAGSSAGIESSSSATALANSGTGNFQRIPGSAAAAPVLTPAAGSTAPGAGQHQSLSSRSVEANQRIVVDLSDRLVYLYENDQISGQFQIAVGRAGWETPTGAYEVISKQPNPVWQNPLTDEVVPPGANNPLGTHWIGFWTDGKNQLGFHGTNQDELIGQAVSHGCIRMRNADIQELFNRVALSTPVTIQP